MPKRWLAPTRWLCMVALCLSQATEVHAAPEHDGGRREASAFVRALEAANACRARALLSGRPERCSRLGGPHADIGADLLDLAYGPEQWVQPRRRHTRASASASACQRAVGRAVVGQVRSTLLANVHQPEAAGDAPDDARESAAGIDRTADAESKRSTQPWRAALARLARMRDHQVAGIERACAGTLRTELGRGQIVPNVGPVCAGALGPAGARIDAPALDRCVRTVAATWVGRAFARARPRRPNIVVILTDDQRFDTLDATHSPDPTTGAPAMPQLMDRVAGQGVTFGNAFVTTPVCDPSRASILTGRYAHRHGVLRNVGTQGSEHFDDRRSIATVLDDAGYRTGFVGKYSTTYATTRSASGAYPHRPEGWDVFTPFFNSGSIGHARFILIERGVVVQYGPGNPAYSTDVLARHAREFIVDAAASPEPFFLLISTAGPHYPYQPAARHAGAFDDAAPWTPPNFFPADVSLEPAWVRALPALDIFRYISSLLTRRAQLEMGLSIDDMLGEIVATLEAEGIADDTAIVFTSDNGLSWGEHRWLSKACPWEACVRVPLVVRYPQLAPLRREVDAMALNIDVAPTLADLAGAYVPADWDGRSLVGVLDGREREPRTEFLVESYSGDDRSFVGVRTPDWSYVEYLSGEEALYDLNEDPYELVNRASDPGMQAQRGVLRARRDALWPGWGVVQGVGVPAP